MRKYISTKATEKVVKMIEPLTIPLVKQLSPKLQKKTYSSTNDLIIPSLRTKPLSDQQMKQEEFKLKQRDQALKEKDYALKKKQAVLTGIGLAAPAVMAGLAYKNHKDTLTKKSTNTKIEDLKEQMAALKVQNIELKTQIEILNARTEKQEQERLLQNESSLYSRLFGSVRR